jgi:hypothetical protein
VRARDPGFIRDNRYTDELAHHYGDFRSATGPPVMPLENDEFCAIDASVAV